MGINALLKYHDIEDPFLRQIKKGIKRRVKQLRKDGVAQQSILEAIRADNIFNRYVGWTEIDKLARSELEYQSREKNDDRDLESN